MAKRWTQAEIARRLGPEYGPGGKREGQEPDPADLYEDELEIERERRSGRWRNPPEETDR